MPGKTRIGLWIDQKKAVVVIVTGKGEEIKTIPSGEDSCFKHSNGASPINDFGRKDFPAHDLIEKDMDMHYQKYYDEVIALICKADAVYVFGPGSAKDMLKKRMEANSQVTRNVKVETADKMTDNQIKEKVKNHYLPHSVTNPGSVYNKTLN